jgi:hypothetical protein
MTLLPLSGTLHYDNSRCGKKLILQVDQELSNYYRALCPKWLNVKPQRYAAHISVVRNETPPKMEHWGKYQGDTIHALYEPCVYNDEAYYWLNVFSSRLEDIRTELGLPVSSPYTLPPAGFEKCFHLTIGNMKRIR